MVIPAGETGRPSVGAALSAGQQVVGAELVVAADAEAQFEGERVGREQAGAGLGEEMADQWRGEAMGELEFFIAGRMEEEEGFNALKLTPAEPAGPRPRRSPACRSSGFRTAGRLRPRRAPSSAEAKTRCAPVTTPLQ